jgi:hypothetical protein
VVEKKWLVRTAMDDLRRSLKKRPSPRRDEAYWSALQA